MNYMYLHLFQNACISRARIKKLLGEDDQESSSSLAEAEVRPSLILNIHIYFKSFSLNTCTAATL